MNDLHAWYDVAVMHACTTNERPSRGALRFIALLLVVCCMCGAGCRGKRADRFRRMRQDFPDTYRVALVHVDDPMATLAPAARRNLTDAFRRELEECPEFRVTDPDTLGAFLRQRGTTGTFRGLPADQKEQVGEALDLEGFLVPHVVEAPRSDRVSLGTELYNGYTGQVLWQRETTEPARGVRDREAATIRAFRRLVDFLRSDLARLVALQKEGQQRRTAAEPATPTWQPDDRPAGLEFGRRPSTVDGPAAPTAPSYEGGVEQLCYDVPGWTTSSGLSLHAPLKAAALEYRRNEGPTFVVGVHDQTAPLEAQRYLDDMFAGATAQSLHGCRAFALRDRVDGRLAVGCVVGKFVVVVESPSGFEASVVELADGFVQANQSVVAFYRAHPKPPQSTVPVVQQPVRIVTTPGPVKETVIREVQTKIERVEIPKTVVPTIEIRIDRDTLLTLVQDRRASTADTVVLQPAPVPTKQPTPAVTRQPAATPAPTPPPVEDVPRDEPTETPASPMAQLRYEMGCRYMATNRLDKAVEAFHAALTIDRFYGAPRRKLQEIRDRYGMDVDIPPVPAPEPPTPPPASSAPATVATTAAPSPSSPPSPSAAAPSVPTSGDEPSDTILIVGLLVVLAVVVIKFVFLDEGPPAGR